MKTEAVNARNVLPDLSHERLLEVACELADIVGMFSEQMLVLCLSRPDLMLLLADTFEVPAKRAAVLADLVNAGFRPNPPVERPVEQEEFEDADEECDE